MIDKIVQPTCDRRPLKIQDISIIILAISVLVFGVMNAINVRALSNIIDRVNILEKNVNGLQVHALGLHDTNINAMTQKKHKDEKK